MWFEKSDDYFYVSGLEIDIVESLESLLKKSTLSSAEKKEKRILEAIEKLNLDIEQFNVTYETGYQRREEMPVTENQIYKHDELEKRKNELRQLYYTFHRENDEREERERIQKVYYNENKIHFDIKDELHELNTKMETLISLFRQDSNLSKTGQKSSKRTRSSTKKYGLSRKQSSAMRIALKKARQKGYKDYSTAMRKMISSAIHRAK